MILEKNNLQTAQERTKSYVELIASYVHPETGNHLRSHLTAIMARDRLGHLTNKRKVVHHILLVWGSGPRTSIATSCHGPEGGSTRCIGLGAQNFPTT